MNGEFWLALIVMLLLVWGFWKAIQAIFQKIIPIIMPNKRIVPATEAAVKIKYTHTAEKKKDQFIIAFDYVDAEGEKSNRKLRVDVIELNNGDAPQYINGYCSLRRQARTFRTDRMSNVIEQKNGEIFEDGEQFIRFFLKDFIAGLSKGSEQQNAKILPWSN